MKKCPFCAEKIQAEAIKCKHCGEWLTDNTSDKIFQEQPDSSELHHNETSICDNCRLEYPYEDFVEGSPICKKCADEISKSPPSFKPDSTFSDQSNLKNIGKFILLYLAVTFLSRISQAVLGGLAKVMEPSVYIITKILPPIIIFVIFLYILSKRKTYTKAIKDLFYVYVVMAVLIMLYGMLRVDQNQFNDYSSYPYFILLIVSAVLFYFSRSKEIEEDNVSSDNQERETTVPTEADSEQAIVTKYTKIALLFSLFWLAGIGSLIGIIYALKALKKIKGSKFPLSGKGMAIFCLILGILGLSFWAVAILGGFIARTT